MHISTHFFSLVLKKKKKKALAINFTMYKTHTYYFKTYTEYTCLKKLRLWECKIKYIGANTGTIPIYRNSFKIRYKNSFHNQLF